MSLLVWNCCGLDNLRTKDQFAELAHLLNGINILRVTPCGKDLTELWLLMIGSSIFPRAKIHHLDVTTSNHKVVWIVPERMECSFQKLFRFEYMWITDKGCSDTVEAVWRKDEDEPWDTKIITKVDNYGRELTCWSRQIFGSVKRELEKKRKQLIQAEKVAIHEGNSSLMKRLEGEINLLLDKEATMWRQR
ncbi:uncharacterized protein LOC142629154 [Castanea sativa]|uniref:uncharacterized protein LOC142629154 n=1 Tax=Castanea sativa TaxID=21020 RepID=UPI003F6549A0